MMGYIRLVPERRAQPDLSWALRWKLEGSLWGGVVVIVWVTLAPYRPDLGAEAAHFAEWIALGLAGIAALTAIQVKWRIRRKLEPDPPKTIGPHNPLGLIDVLREHGVREFGSMYLYMPMPRRAKHGEAWAWLEMLAMKGLIKGEAWHIKANHVGDTVRQSHPGLFEGAPTHFDVYRLDWRTLTQMMGDELE